jgi:hypothetical protein
MPLVDHWVVARSFELLREFAIADRYVFAINLSAQSVGRQDFLGRGTRKVCRKQTSLPTPQMNTHFAIRRFAV